MDGASLRDHREYLAKLHSFIERRYHTRDSIEVKCNGERVGFMCGVGGGAFVPSTLHCNGMLFRNGIVLREIFNVLCSKFPLNAKIGTLVGGKVEVTCLCRRGRT